MESHAEIEQLLYNEFIHSEFERSEKQQVIHVKIDYFEICPEFDCSWEINQDFLHVSLSGPDLYSTARYLVAQWSYPPLLKKKKDLFVRFKGLYYVSIIIFVFLSSFSILGFALKNTNNILFLLLTLIFIGIIISERILYSIWKYRLKIRYIGILHISSLKFTEDEIIRYKREVPKLQPAHMTEKLFHQLMYTLLGVWCTSILVLKYWGK